MRLFLLSIMLFASIIGLMLLWGDAAGAAIRHRDCPERMGESCPRDYGIRLCPTLAYDIATTQKDIDPYEFDFLMHSAGCDQKPSGAWVKRTSASIDANLRCSRRAYWLVDHGFSLLTAREQLLLRGCRQFEDGTYYDARHG